MVLIRKLHSEERLVLLEVVDVDSDISWLIRSGEWILGPTTGDDRLEEQSELQWLKAFDHFHGYRT